MRIVCSTTRRISARSCSPSESQSRRRYQNRREFLPLARRGEGQKLTRIRGGSGSVAEAVAERRGARLHLRHEVVAVRLR
ncbi:hypothetical protein EU513_08595 [Yimella sp. RIT 621]|nr:hypothetical protein EU513_08595 [Yimella sp. RIT 621]